MVSNNQKKISLSIVIPCYNEEARLSILEDALQDLCALNYFELEIIIVDDGSSDQTSAKVQSSPFLNQFRESNHFIFVSLPDNKGKGGALREGVLRANGDFILTMDTDISTHPNELINWEKLLGSSFNSDEILIASRTHTDSILIEKPFRKFTGSIFNFCVRILTGIRFRDSQCGFKLYPSTIGKKLFSELHENGWAHDVEILMRAKLLSMSVREMPVQWIVRDNSKVNIFSDSIGMFIQLINISRRVKNSFKTSP